MKYPDYKVGDLIEGLRGVWNIIEIIKEQTEDTTAFALCELVKPLQDRRQGIGYKLRWFLNKDFKYYVPPSLEYVIAHALLNGLDVKNTCKEFKERVDG